jgi:hypothetical protein
MKRRLMMFLKILAQIVAVICCILAIIIAVKTDSVLLRLLMITVSGIAGALAGYIYQSWQATKEN